MKLQAFEPLESIANSYAEAFRVPELDWYAKDGRANSLMVREPTEALIMIVDDEPVNIKVVREYLRLEGYRQFLSCDDPKKAVSLIQQENPDVVILDLMMPEVSGLDILNEIRHDPELMSLPVLILTAADDRDTKMKAFNEGATDFLSKPVDPAELLPRVRNASIVKWHHDTMKNYARTLEENVRRRTAELSTSRMELLHCLAKVAEFRDNETGKHVIRVGQYVGAIARQMGFDPITVELLELAAPLHDMGKIGIPDAILNKTRSLDENEFTIMKRHCGLGKRAFESITSEEWKSMATHTYVGETILEASRSPILELAARIALTHHERWDGSGYPLGLSGEEIPIEGRITAVADVFDALSSERPYKQAFPLEKCFNILTEGRGNHFDPDVLDAFFATREEIVKIRIENADID